MTLKCLVKKTISSAEIKGKQNGCFFSTLSYCLCMSSHQRGAVFGMPSEEIRRVLRALAQENSLERRFKEAVEAEIANCSREELVRRYLKARAQDGRSDAVWERRLRELFRKESKSRGGSSARSQSKQNHEEADKADSLRQQRVGRMKRELPLMSLTELRRMMNTW